MSRKEGPGRQENMKTIKETEEDHVAVLDWARKISTITELEEIRQYSEEKGCCGGACVFCTNDVVDCIDEVLKEKKEAK